MIDIQGATPTYARKIRSILETFPRWYSGGARVEKVVVSNDPEVKEQIAAYQHGSRVLRVAPDVGDVLRRALAHELAHGVDDIFGHPHYFSAMPEWQMIHRNQGHFDLPKYRDEALEYFADMLSKLILFGDVKLRTTHPDETNFLCGRVLPVLVQNFDRSKQ